MFKVVIAGGEGYEDYPAFEKKCISCLRNKAKEGCGIMIYTTGDKFVELFCNRFHIDIRLYETDWKKNGSDALAVRNEEMLSTANAAIIFDDGTKDMSIMIEQAKNKGVALRVIKKSTND